MSDQDIFPLYDAELDTDHLDIFRPLPLRPYERALIDRSSTQILPSNTQSPTNRTSTSIPPKATPATNNLYCKECKKKFNNDATMQNHQKSAKHLAAVKKAKGNGKGTLSPAQVKEREGFINPETTVSLQKMETIGKMPCDQAAPAYLNLAQEFYKQKRPLYTGNALVALISLNLNSDTHWIAQSALARLYCLYNKQMNLAYDIYLNILQEKWSVKKGDIAKLSETCGRSSAEAIMDECGRLIQGITTSPALITLLEESASAFAQVNTVVMERPGLAEKMAIILYGFAFAAYEDEEKSFGLCPMISKVFEKLGFAYSSMDIKLMYGNYLVRSLTTEQHTQMLLFFSILLEATEKDDYLRIEKINRHIQASNGTIYPDLLLLTKISGARRNLDYHLLAHELKFEADHIELQMASGDSRLLLVGLDNGSQLDYLDRLRRCLQLA